LRGAYLRVIDIRRKEEKKKRDLIGFSLLYLVLNGEAAQIVGKYDKVVSPTFFRHNKVARQRAAPLRITRRLGVWNNYLGFL